MFLEKFLACFSKECCHWVSVVGNRKKERNDEKNAMRSTMMQAPLMSSLRICTVID